MILAAELGWASKILPLGLRAAPSGLGPRGRILQSQPRSAARISTVQQPVAGLAWLSLTDVTFCLSPVRGWIRKTFLGRGKNMISPLTPAGGGGGRGGAPKKEDYVHTLTWWDPCLGFDKCRSLTTSCGIRTVVKVTVSIFLLLQPRLYLLSLWETGIFLVKFLSFYMQKCYIIVHSPCSSWGNLFASISIYLWAIPK